MVNTGANDYATSLHSISPIGPTPMIIEIMPWPFDPRKSASGNHNASPDAGPSPDINQVISDHFTMRDDRRRRGRYHTDDDSQHSSQSSAFSDGTEELP
jgi:hypothetical protein